MIGGGRLLGEGLRAAGLTKRKDGPEDVFVSPSRNGSMAPPAVIPRRTRSTGSGSILSGDRESPTPGTSSGRGEGVGPPASSQRTMDLRTPAPRQSDRSVTYALQGRPGTSMAALHGDSPNMPPPRTAPPNTVTFRTSLREDQMTSQLPEDLHRNDQARTEVSLPPPRAYTSPFAPPRALSTTFSPPPTSGNANDPFFEHRRLMLESLSIFESHLSRIPPMGQMTTTTIPEVFQSSQHLIHTMDKLNSMLKVATNRALESQIEAEVSDQGGEVNMSEIWTKVGMEHRDNLRLSDEVVRTMTGFLLGVGKILREATNASSQQQHLRTLSLDDDVGSRRGTPEVNLNSLPVDRRSSDGRKSRETRRSWDPREAVNLTALTSTSKAGLLGRERTGLTSRPASSMDIVRTSTASSSEGRSVQGVEGTPQPARNIASTLVGSLRRPYTPRELRLGAVEGPASDPVVRKSLASYNSHDTLQEYEPSPTPAARLNGGRILVPLSIPPSLPTLPSETTLRRNGTISASNSSSSHPTPSSSNGGSSDNALSSRRKVSTNSNITVRGESSTSSFQPILKPASVTTAVTPHTVSVSISPESQLQNLPPTRNEARHTSTNTVTFSRSATTLAGIRQQQRQEEQERRMRTISTSGLPSEEEPSPVSATNLRSPMSGSETERPRTFAFRGRFSLDGAKGEDRDRIGLGSQATTLITTRRERRKTMTENFWQR